jgi:hypothetical protein
MSRRPNREQRAATTADADAWAIIASPGRCRGRDDVGGRGPGSRGVRTARLFSQHVEKLLLQLRCERLLLR